MKIAVIGASAGVGLETVNQALARGHQVTTLSRRIDSLPEHPALTKVQGSSLVADDVRQAIAGAEAILVTLGTGANTQPTTLYTDSAKVLLQVLGETGATPPLIVVTGFGAGASWDYNGPVMKLLFRWLLKDVYADKSAMERMIVNAYPRWEMVRPGRLTPGPATGRYRVIDELKLGMRVGGIARANVAHFLVAQAENPDRLGTYPALSN